MSHEANLPSPEAVMRMATGYLAQRATSAAHLRQVLDRRIRRRALREGGEGLETGAIAGLLDGVIARLERAGLLDDAAFAAAKARSLAGKGLPGWRITRELAQKGVALDHEHAPQLDPEAQARRFAERKRLGPFRLVPRPDLAERDLRALVRAGFPPRLARAVLVSEPDEASCADEPDEC